jgi:charged multivesicular body protein 3
MCHTFSVVKAKEWKRDIKSEIRSMDREIRILQREEDKVVKEIKKLGKDPVRAGDSIKILAKQIVHCRKVKERQFMARANLNSVSMTLAQQGKIRQNKMTR